MPCGLPRQDEAARAAPEAIPAPQRLARNFKQDHHIRRRQRRGRRYLLFDIADQNRWRHKDDPTSYPLTADKAYVPQKLTPFIPSFHG